MSLSQWPQEDHWQPWGVLSQCCLSAVERVWTWFEAFIKVVWWQIVVKLSSNRFQAASREMVYNYPCQKSWRWVSLRQVTATVFNFRRTNPVLSSWEIRSEMGNEITEANFLRKAVGARSRWQEDEFDVLISSEIWAVVGESKWMCQEWRQREGPLRG